MPQTRAPLAGGLDESIRETEQYLEQLINLIPPRHYLASLLDAAPPDSAYHRHKRVKTDPEVLKMKKRARMDPGTYKSVSDIHAERAAARALERVVPTGASDADDSDDDVSDDVSEEEAGPEASQISFGPLKVGGETTGRVPLDALASRNAVEKLAGSVSNSKRKQRERPAETLARLEEQRKRLEALPDDKRRDAALEGEWDKALRRAHGEKVKDNPALLKRTLKQAASKKSHSKKEWRTRVATVEKSQRDRQVRRAANIAERRTKGKSSGSSKKASKNAAAKKATAKKLAAKSGAGKSGAGKSGAGKSGRRKHSR